MTNAQSKMDELVDAPVDPAIGLGCMKYLTNHPEKVRRMSELVLLAYARYPMSDNTNRFIYGKTCERALMDALQDCGQSVLDVSNESRVDMQVGDIKFSIKTSINVGEIILENYRGNKRGIEKLPPTFAILFDRKDKKMHMLYIDNDTVETSEFAKPKYKHSDANLTLKRAFVQHLVKTLGSDRKITIDLPELRQEQCVQKNMMDFVWQDLQSAL